MTLSHHDVFALAGYATTAMHKALHRNTDVIHATHATIELFVKSEYTGRPRQGLRLTAYYQRNVSTMLREITKEDSTSTTVVLEADHPLYRVNIMPLQRHAYSRPEIDDAIEYLDKACQAVRDHMANNDSEVNA